MSGFVYKVSQGASKCVLWAFFGLIAFAAYGQGPDISQLEAAPGPLYFIMTQGQYDLNFKGELQPVTGLQNYFEADTIARVLEPYLTNIGVGDSLNGIYSFQNEAKYRVVDTIRYTGNHSEIFDLSATQNYILGTSAQIEYDYGTSAFLRMDTETGNGVVTRFPATLSGDGGIELRASGASGAAMTINQLNNTTAFQTGLGWRMPSGDGFQIRGVDFLGTTKRLEFWGYPSAWGTGFEFLRFQLEDTTHWLPAMGANEPKYINNTSEYILSMDANGEIWLQEFDSLQANSPPPAITDTSIFMVAFSGDTLSLYRREGVSGTVTDTLQAFLDVADLNGWWDVSNKGTPVAFDTIVTNVNGGSTIWFHNIGTDPTVYATQSLGLRSQGTGQYIIYSDSAPVGSSSPQAAFQYILLPPAFNTELTSLRSWNAPLQIIRSISANNPVEGLWLYSDERMTNAHDTILLTGAPTGIAPMGVWTRESDTRVTYLPFTTLADTLNPYIEPLSDTSIYQMTFANDTLYLQRRDGVTGGGQSTLKVELMGGTDYNGIFDAFNNGADELMDTVKMLGNKDIVWWSDASSTWMTFGGATGGLLELLHGSGVSHRMQTINADGSDLYIDVDFENATAVGSDVMFAFDRGDNLAKQGRVAARLNDADDSWQVYDDEVETNAGMVELDAGDASVAITGAGTAYLYLREYDFSTTSHWLFQMEGGNLIAQFETTTGVDDNTFEIREDNNEGFTFHLDADGSQGFGGSWLQFDDQVVFTTNKVAIIDASGNMGFVDSTTFRQWIGESPDTDTDIFIERIEEQNNPVRTNVRSIDFQTDGLDITSNPVTDGEVIFNFDFWEFPARSGFALDGGEYIVATNTSNTEFRINIDTLAAYIDTDTTIGWVIDADQGDVEYVLGDTILFAGGNDIITTYTAATNTLLIDYNGAGGGGCCLTIREPKNEPALQWSPVNMLIIETGLWATASNDTVYLELAIETLVPYLETDLSLGSDYFAIFNGSTNSNEYLSYGGLLTELNEDLTFFNINAQGSSPAAFPRGGTLSILGSGTISTSRVDQTITISTSDPDESTTNEAWFIEGDDATAQTQIDNDYIRFRGSNGIATDLVLGLGTSASPHTLYIDGSDLQYSYSWTAGYLNDGAGLTTHAVQNAHQLNFNGGTGIEIVRTGSTGNYTYTFNYNGGTQTDRTFITDDITSTQSTVHNMSDNTITLTNMSPFASTLFFDGNQSDVPIIRAQNNANIDWYIGIDGNNFAIGESFLDGQIYLFEGSPNRSIQVNTDGQIRFGAYNGDNRGVVNTGVLGIDVSGDIERIANGSNGQVLTVVSGEAQWANAPSGSGDNLGNHTATQNIQLNGNWLSRDGDSEGVFVNTDGTTIIQSSSGGPELQVIADDGLTSSLVVLGGATQLRQQSNGITTGSRKNYFEFYNERTGGSQSDYFTIEQYLRNSGLDAEKQSVHFRMDGGGVNYTPMTLNYDEFFGSGGAEGWVRLQGGVQFQWRQATSTNGNVYKGDFVVNVTSTNPAYTLPQITTSFDSWADGENEVSRGTMLVICANGNGNLLLLPPANHLLNGLTIGVVIAENTCGCVVAASSTEWNTVGF